MKVAFCPLLAYLKGLRPSKKRGLHITAFKIASVSHTVSLQSYPHFAIPVSGEVCDPLVFIAVINLNQSSSVAFAISLRLLERPPRINVLVAVFAVSDQVAISFWARHFGTCNMNVLSALYASDKYTIVPFLFFFWHPYGTRPRQSKSFHLPLML